MTNEEAKKLWFDSIEIVKCDMAKAEPDKLAAKFYLLGEEVLTVFDVISGPKSKPCASASLTAKKRNIRPLRTS